jgi:hypothetical protein
MSDVLRALGISAAILLPVIVFLVFLSYVVVNRGEAEMKKHGHH